MTISWGGWEGLLALDCAEIDTTITVFDATDSPTLPFDITLALERMTVTAKADTVDFGTDTEWTVTRGVNDTPAVAEGYFAGAGLTEVRHEYKVRNPDGSVIDLTAIAQTCVQEQAAGIGDSQVVIGFDTYDPSRYFPDPEAILTMSSNESGTMVPYQSGILTNPKERRATDGGYHYELRFVGLGSTLGWSEYEDTLAPTKIYDSSFSPPLLTGYVYLSGYGWWAPDIAIHTVVENILRDLSNYVYPASPIDGSLQIGKEFNGQWQTAAQLFNELSAMGDGDNGPLDWGVWTDADGSAKLYFMHRDRFQTVDIPFNASIVLPREEENAWNTEDCKTTMVVKYASGTASASQAVADVDPKVGHVDDSSSIQDWYTAQNIADSSVKRTAILQNYSESPIVLEYKADAPSTKYLTLHGGSTEIAIWRIRACWKTHDPDLTPVNSKWPIYDQQIKHVSIDHVARTATITRGKYVDQFTHVVSYAHAASLPPDSLTHNTGVVGTVCIQPPGLNRPGATVDSVAPLGPGGGTGPQSVAGPLGEWGVQTPMWVFGGGDVAPVADGGVIHFSFGGYVTGFRFKGASAARGPCTVSFEVRYGTYSDYPSCPLLVATFIISAANKQDLVLIPNETPGPDGGYVPITPGDQMLLTITSNSDCAEYTMVPIFSRTTGSDRTKHTGPAVLKGQTVEISPDGHVNFNLTADQPVLAYVAYGSTPGIYGQFTQKTTNLAIATTCVALSVPASGGLRYAVAHLFTHDNVESVSELWTF